MNFFLSVLLQLNHGIEEPFVYNTYTNIDRKYLEDVYVAGHTVSRFIGLILLLKIAFRFFGKLLLEKKECCKFACN